MISVSFSTVGQSSLVDYEIVWNGTIEHDWVSQWRQPAPRLPTPARAARSLSQVLGATGAQSRFLAYLEAHRDGFHDSGSVASALQVAQNVAHAWLVRAHRRGIVEPCTVITRGGRPARVYRVVQP